MPHTVFLPSGETLRCTVCSFEQFVSIRGSIASRAMEFFGFAFASPKAVVVVCSNCGFGHWFLGPVATEELGRRRPGRGSSGRGS